MFEAAGRLSGTAGAACAESGTTNALAAKKTAKTPDFNMIPLTTMPTCLGDNTSDKAQLPRLSLIAALAGLKPPVGITRPVPVDGLLPEGHDDRVVVVEDQIDAVRVMDNPRNPMARRNRAETARQVFFAHGIGCSGRCFALLGKFFPDALLAVFGLDLGTSIAGNLLDRQGIGAGADPHAFVGMAGFEREHC